MPVKTTKVPESGNTKTDKSTDKPYFDETTSENKPDDAFFGEQSSSKGSGEGEKSEQPEQKSKSASGEATDDADKGSQGSAEKETYEAISGESSSKDVSEETSDDEGGEGSDDGDEVGASGEQSAGEEGKDGEDGEEEKEEDPRDARIAQLERIIEDMSKSVDTEIRHKEPTKEKQEEGAEAANTLIGDMSDDEFDKITTSKEAFTEFLSKFGNQLIAKSSESTLRTVPEVINKSIKRQSQLNKAISDFYNKNPDLKSHSKYVGYVFTQKQSESPDKDLKTLFSETEQEVRKNLQLNKTAVDRENERLKNKQKNNQSRPAKPGSGRGASRSAGKDTRTDQQKQIDEILI